MAKNKLTHCVTCGQEVASGAKSCPHCGAKIKQPIFKKWWFWLLVICFIFGAAGSSGSENSSSSVTTSSTISGTVEPVSDLALEGEVTVTTESSIDYLCGIVRNNRDEDYTYAQITFTLYDADGNQIGTALDNINNLKAGGTWKFKAAILDLNEDVASWELTEITGF